MHRELDLLECEAFAATIDILQTFCLRGLKKNREPKSLASFVRFQFHPWLDCHFDADLE